MHSFKLIELYKKKPHTHTNPSCFRCPVRVMNPRLFNVLVNLKAYAKNANLGGPGSLRD